MTETQYPNPPKENRCPICKKPTDPGDPSFPFCTPRCRDVDLSKWLGGRYMISRSIEATDLDE